jgi:hypothetical protein
VSDLALYPQSVTRCEEKQHSCYNPRMTRFTKYISTFFAVLTVVSAISQATSAPQPIGRLVILRAPNFGWNLALIFKSMAGLSRMLFRDAGTITQSPQAVMC